jgi:hypothetical protein
MEMYTLYKGTFCSEDNVLYDVEIECKDNSLAKAGELLFSADTPVEIEWAEVDKFEPVQGSSMTLTLVSETDRKYVGLYTIEPGTIRANIYRDGKLYWSGMLDPELYEEPYSYKTNYTVQFTFSDFGILERLEWEKEGLCSMEDILTDCLESTGIQYNELRKYISVGTSAYDAIDMSKLYLLCDNFYDEDGTPMTKREVLEAILQPFALRLVQKGGDLFLFDLNAIYDGLSAEEVYWKSDDAVLGADVVYNDVKLTYSPYGDTTLIDGSLDHDDVLPEKTTGTLWKMDADFDNAADGFRMCTGTQDGLPLTLTGDANFFRIDTEYSGSDEAGVVQGYKGNTDATFRKVYGSFPSVHQDGVYSSSPIFVCKTGFLGNPSYKRTDFNLKIKLDLLFDVRYNPFESAGKKNEDDNYEHLNDWCNFGYIPCMLRLKDADGNVLYHYENSAIMESDSYRQTKGKWVAGDGEWCCMYLCYYDRNNRKSASGFGGWQANKQIIGYYRDGLPKNWEARGDGEFIALPPTGGWLELTIGRGVHQFDYKRKEKNIYDIARWLMYKAPSVTLVNKNGTAIESEDIELTAWVNRNAKEEYEIDTTVGTLGKTPNPAARGIIMDAKGYAVNDFWKAGVSDRLEKLLIGSVYSQYASRKTTLSGTVRLLDTMNVLTDASTEGKFVLLSEVQDLQQETSEITMAEFSADNYEGIEYE